MTKLNTTAFAKTGYTIDIIELLPFLERSGLRLVDYFKLLIIYKGLQKDLTIAKLLTTLPDFQVFDTEKELLSNKPSQKVLYNEQINRLVNNGWLERTDKSFKISKKFTDLFLNKEIAGEEIYGAYKASNIIDNIRQPLKAMDKADFIRAYSKCVGDGEYINAEKHLQVRELIEFAKDVNLGFPNMETFINRFEHYFKLWSEAKSAYDLAEESQKESTVIKLRKLEGGI